MSLSSIVIPVHNKAVVTRDCLDVLVAEPPEVAHEIIVVDDASTDETPALLAGLGDSVRVVRRDSNGGFATACNEGAAAARGDLLVFLNNDTLPFAGWLDSLVIDAEDNGAAVVGAKLLFPNGTIQHAGVVICGDGNPRHLYAGFPADHPAVNRSRRFQAVTAACMLVRREAFDEVQGFDPAFHNCLEDADMCLRLGERGHEVRYCHDSVLYHLESISRGRNTKDVERSGRLFRNRWRDRARVDELDYYLEDGLLRIAHRDAYPIRLDVAPELAAVDIDERREQRLIDAQAAQILDLLKETVRLSGHIAAREIGAPTGDAIPGRSPVNGPVRNHELLCRSREIEVAIDELEAGLAATVAGDGFTPSEYLSYRRLIEEVRAAVETIIPEGATVLVLSRGDEEVTELGARCAWHFPRMDDGTYLGHYPADSVRAIDHLEELRARGAQYLVVPATSFWWLDHYASFADHLRGHYAAVEAAAGTCLIFSLEGAAR